MTLWHITVCIGVNINTFVLKRQCNPTWTWPSIVADSTLFGSPYQMIKNKSHGLAKHEAFLPFCREALLLFALANCISEQRSCVVSTSLVSTPYKSISELFPTMVPLLALLIPFTHFGAASTQTYGQAPCCVVSTCLVSTAAVEWAESQTRQSIAVFPTFFSSQHSSDTLVAKLLFILESISNTQ